MTETAGHAPLEGTTWLVVSQDLAWADGVARALRDHGACVHLLDGQGRGMARLSDVDAQVLLLADGEASATFWQTIESHPGLRCAARVQLSPLSVWPAGRPGPDLDALMRACGPALRCDREVRARAQKGASFDVELSAIGLPRLLRALAPVEGSFVVQLALPDADAHVALRSGQWIGASYRPKVPSTRALDGMAALRRALGLREASCLVLPARKLRVPSWRQPLDVALAQALSTMEAERTGALDDEPTRRALPGERPGAEPGAPSTSAPSLSPGRPSPSRQRSKRPSPLLAASLLTAGVVAGVTALELSEPTPLDATDRPGAPAEGVPAGANGAGAAGEALPALQPGALRVEPLEAKPDASTRDAALDGAASREAGTPKGEPADDAREPDAGSRQRSRQLARAGHRADDPKRAHALYERALRDDPRNPHAVVGLARLARRAGNLRAAVQLMERAVALRSRRASYRLLHGKVLLEAGRPAEALEAFEIARKLRPGQAATQGIARARGALEAGGSTP